MNYYQIHIPVTDAAIQEILIATLSELNFEGFEQQNTGLNAFIPEARFSESELHAVLTPFGLGFGSELIAQQNWNAQWEADFEPVVVGAFCTIRAHFHTLPVQTEHEVIITPKMSFGTGHHATTRLMVEQMQQLGFTGKTVLDFGTGTGILAILAEKLGAASVLGIDNDEWSFENAKENILLNECSRTEISMRDIDELVGPYNIVLANINRHILLRYMERMYSLVVPGGTLLMSGLLTDDESVVGESAANAGFTLQSVQTLNNWITILTKRP